MDTETKSEGRAVPWNKGKLLGQKLPLKLREIWAIRIRLQLTHRHRELALFNLVIDSKLRRVRLGWASRIRRRTGQSRRFPRDRHAEENAAGRAIRRDRANARRTDHLDRHGTAEAGAVSISKSRLRVTASVDSTVLSNRCIVGHIDRT